MIYKKIPLDEADEGAYLEAYIADKINGLCRKAILVIPGGAYGMVCSDREGEPIALAFIPHGFNAFVLHYSVKEKGRFPVPQVQASKAIMHIKDNAEEYGIDKDKVFAVGFSAGGHLAGSLGILYDNEEVVAALPKAERGYNRPRGVMLIYPVVSCINEKIKQAASFTNLLGTATPTVEDATKCSLEANVKADSSPAFILHTANDQVVNVRNSLLLAEAYTDAGVSYEMHVYPDGPHGVALGNEITRCGNAKWEDAAIAQWVAHASYWTEKIIELGV